MRIHRICTDVKRVTTKFFRMLCAGNVKRILEGWWNMKVSCVMKWKQYKILCILVTAEAQVCSLRLL